MVTLDMDVDEIRERLERQSAALAQFRSRVPEGRSGPWRVRRDELEWDLGLLRMVRDGRGSAPGTYTRLVHDKRGVVMSDTDAEIADFRPFVYGATGKVLVVGLGLGVVTQALLDNPAVKHVTVVEIDRDVIKLVKPTLACERLTIVRADARKWEPVGRFNHVWLDIWDDICGDHVADIDRLKAKYRTCSRKVSAWCEREMRRL